MIIIQLVTVNEFIDRVIDNCSWKISVADCISNCVVPLKKTNDIYNFSFYSSFIQISSFYLGYISLFVFTEIFLNVHVQWRARLILRSKEREREPLE